MQTNDNPYWEYEKEKQKLRERDLTPEEYQEAVKALADKLRI